MASYGDMQARIADEVLGSGAVTATHIANAIQDAIKKYERQRFWFNEIRVDAFPNYDSLGRVVTDRNGNSVLTTPFFVTIPGVEFYSALNAPAIATMVHIDRLLIIQSNNNRYVLRPQSTGYVDGISVNFSWRGLPTDWCYVAQKIRLYPIPDLAYPTLIEGTGRLAALVNPADTNAWTVEAEELIRCAAMCILYRRIVRDDQGAQVAAADEQQALASLQSETYDRGPPRSMRVRSYF